MQIFVKTHNYLCRQTQGMKFPPNGPLHLVFVLRYSLRELVPGPTLSMVACKSLSKPTIGDVKVKIQGEEGIPPRIQPPPNSEQHPPSRPSSPFGGPHRVRYQKSAEVVNSDEG
ncbi:hypothetical protein ONZ45_g17766 [Pleurotus djamor]|nr:hypothetical protein ONZ45_g17766 [Pleurotus djamor]